MDVNILVEHKATSRAFSRLQLSQYPFALAQALTRTAKDGQKAIQLRTKRVYDLHGRYTLRNLRVRPARKSDVLNRRTAYSEVYTDKRIPYMPQHEPGDIKTARESKFLAVPMSDIKRKRYRTAKGVKSNYSPEELIKKRNVFVIKNAKGVPLMIRRKQKSKKVIKPATAKSTMNKVKKRKRKPVEFLWAFVKRAKIKPTWRFEQTIKSRVSRTFDKHFRQSMKKALMTAR